MEPGDVVGRYRIDGRLGRGGMGEVYLAFDPVLRRQVALKVLLADRYGEREVARVLREARSAAALRHPNAVAIHDAGEVDGVSYIVMELVEGKTLREVARDGRAPLAEALRWLRQVALALRAAHAAGLVHRDVKPENVMVLADGTVKLLDFGIAKRSAASVDDVPPSSAALTADGAIVGTPKYMAPEQLVGLPCDGRVDQFAWGLMAFELLVGTHPRSLGPHAHPSRAVLDERARVLPDPLREVVLRTLSLGPDGRYPSMDALVTAFDDAVASTERSDTVRSDEPAFAGGAGALETRTGERVPRVVPEAAPQTAKEEEGGPPKAFVIGAFGLAALGVVVGALGWAIHARNGSLPVPEIAPGARAVAARCANDPARSRRVALADGPAPTLSVVRDDKGGVFVSTGQTAGRSNVARVERIDDGSASERIDVTLAGALAGAPVLATLEGEPAIVWEAGGIIAARSLRAMSPSAAFRTSGTRASSGASLAAASTQRDLVVASLGIEGASGAEERVVRVVWMSERCNAQGAELVMPRSGPGAASGARPEVAVGDDAAYVAVLRSDLTLQVTRFEMQGKTDTRPCALAVGQTIGGIRGAVASLVTVEGAVEPRVIAYASPTRVRSAALGAASALPAFFAPELARPRGGQSGATRLAAWVDTTDGGTRVRVGVVESTTGEVTAALSFAGSHAPRNVAVASGRSDAVVAFLEGTEVRVESVRCE